jgi:hypothetical protein
MSYVRRLSMFFKSACWMLQCVTTLAWALPLRFLGIRLVVVDSSITWLGTPTSAVIRSLFLHGCLAIRMRDVLALYKMLCRNTSRAPGDSIPDSATYAACVALELLPWEFSQQSDRVQDVLTLHSTQHLQMLDALSTVDRWARIHALIYAQGYAPSAHACRCFGVANGRRIVAFENCAHKELMLWDDVSGITVHRNLARNVYFRYRDLLSPGQANIFSESYLAGVTALKSNEHRAGSKRLRIDSRYIVFLGQVMTDSSLVFGAQNHWGPLETITATMREGQRLGYTVVIKLHPKEAVGSPPVVGDGCASKPYDRLTYRRLMASAKIELGGHVIIDATNEYDTYALLANAAAAVTVNSQAGLEAAIMGVPVLVCGAAFYSGMNFTLDCIYEQEFEKALEIALKLTSQQKERFQGEARLFFFSFMNMYCVRKSASRVAAMTMKRGAFAPVSAGYPK